MLTRAEPANPDRLKARKRHDPGGFARRTQREPGNDDLVDEPAKRAEDWRADG
ncbi:hypothetical protein NHF46_14910 [Arthrobacter alpinus]|nr:hypothetical protein [Arthrobacter alpinus]